MKYPNIIGREVEISALERLYKSKKSEFVAIYGRRRIGKSYLVSEVYGSKIVFSAVGTYVKDGDKNYETYRKLQLDHFYDSLVLSGLDAATTERPTCWREAFLLLRRLLEGKPSCFCEGCLKVFAPVGRSSLLMSCLGWPVLSRPR